MLSLEKERCFATSGKSAFPPLFSFLPCHRASQLVQSAKHHLWTSSFARLLANSPKTTQTTTHAPPSSSSQPLFLVNPAVQSTPLRPTAASRAAQNNGSHAGGDAAAYSEAGGVTDPEVLLGAALKLVDG
jgi:hypothetical protein